MIKLIVHTFTSLPDRYSNSYSLTRFTITKTGEQFHFFYGHGHGSSDAQATASVLVGYYPNYYSMVENLSIREWNRLEASLKDNLIYSHEELKDQLQRALKRRKALKKREQK